MNRKGGSRRKSRHLMKKKIREKGKISISKYLEKYEAGDKVVLKAEPAVQKGLFHMRFFGKTGIVKRVRGKCYEVLIKDKNKEKLLIIPPIHLRRLQ